MVPDQPSDPPLRRVTIDGISFAYTDEGEGPVIVALHGLPGSHRDFRWLAAALGGRVRMIRLDLPGFGATRADVVPQRWSEIVIAVRRFAERVVDGPWVVLGHSFGAPLASRVAAAGAPVAGLAWLAPVGLRPHRLVRRLPPLRAVARLARMPIVGRPLLHAWRAGLRVAGFPASVAIEDVARTLDVLGGFQFASHVDAVAALRIPTFAAWTDDDTLVEPAVIHELYAAAPAGPRLGFATGGHNLQKTRATELADALVPFVLACIPPPGPHPTPDPTPDDAPQLPLDDSGGDRQSRRPIPK